MTFKQVRRITAVVIAAPLLPLCGGCSNSPATAPTGASEASATEKENLTMQQALEKRVAESDLVVSGKVTQIRPLPLVQAAGQPRFREHETPWQEAVVNVTRVLKGPQPTQNQVVVRFPSFPPDVSLVFYPRYQLNQDGIFLLKRAQVAGHPQAMIANQPVQAYLGTPKARAKEEPDLLPAGELPKIQALLGAGAATRPASEPGPPG